MPVRLHGKPKLKKSKRTEQACHAARDKENRTVSWAPTSVKLAFVGATSTGLAVVYVTLVQLHGVSELPMPSLPSKQPSQLANSRVQPSAANYDTAQLVHPADAHNDVAPSCTMERGYANNRIEGIDNFHIMRPELCVKLCSDQQGRCNCWSWKDDGFCRVGMAMQCTYVASPDDNRWMYGTCPERALPTLPPLPLLNEPASVTAKDTEKHVAASASDPKLATSSSKGMVHESSPAAGTLAPVLMMTYNRAHYLERALASVQRHLGRPEAFPVFASQDGNDAAVQRVLQKYLTTGLLTEHLHFQPQNFLPAGYARLCAHYRWAFSEMFDKRGHEQLIVLEEDIEVAPDFFSYFEATYPLLKADPELFCVSAWNDNGKAALASDSKALFRTDFFPGLGWMLLSSFWQEVKERWPKSYWDEFLRHPEVRRGRQCIRPEISRTHTFGEQGVSKGQFFKQHLALIALNEEPIDWTKIDLSFLSNASAFDKFLETQVKEAEVVSFEALPKVKAARPMAILYEDKDWKKYAKFFGLMEDERAGVRRGAYRGVLPFSWHEQRAFLVRDWPLRAAA